MPRGACTFRQGDMTKALKALRDAGWVEGRVEVTPDGTLAVVVGKAADPAAAAAQQQANEWDAVE